MMRKLKLMKTIASGHGENRMGNGGFTLIELLVVIVIIGILAALLLPMLGKAKEAGRSTQCLSNLRQLQLSWQLYADDHGDRLVPNGEDSTSGKTPDNPSWVGGWLDFRPNNPDNFDVRFLIDPTYLYGGMLGPYAQNPGIFRCPSDRSMAQLGNRPQLRMRSYSLNHYMNRRSLMWMGRSVYKKIDQVRHPAKVFAFLEEGWASISDGAFVSNPPGPTPSEVADHPAFNHGKTGNLIFADGHSQKQRWKQAEHARMGSSDLIPLDALVADLQWLWQRSSDPE